MPCLIVHRNFQIKEKETAVLQDRLAAIIENVLQKPKKYIMVIVDDRKPIRFGGSDDPALYIEVKSVGLPGETPALLSREICSAASEMFPLSPDRIYLEFADSPGRLWGWNSGTF